MKYTGFDTPRSCAAVIALVDINKLRLRWLFSQHKKDPGGSSVLSLILFNIVTFKIESISDMRV